MATPTPTWQDYRHDAFGEPYMVWHDGADFSAFRQRMAEDPATAEAVLLEGLAQQDPLAAQAVAEARFAPEVAQRFIPVLTAALPQTGSTFRVSVAQALVELTGEQHWSSEIVLVLVLHNAAAWSDRLDAAIALGHLTPTVALIAALMKGMQDPEYLVRYHSANSLLRYGGATGDVSHEAEWFPLIIEKANPEQWMLAASALAGTASARLTLGQSGE